MGDNIPSTSLPRKRSRKKYDATKLPTPPPDPTEKDDFLSYLESLQKSSAVYSRSISFAEDAFDHLEKLYKLMEQMLELREQNAKLHRRVRDLEHLNNLEKMHRDLEEHIQEECPELDKDTAFAETILESILAEAKAPKKGPTRFRSSISRKTTRSGSVNLEPQEVKSDRRASTGVDLDTRKKPSKVSKWTKVKAAFKWEKAANVSDTKSQDSGVGGMVEVARYLRVPSCDEHGHSPVDSGAAEISTPGTMSTASSTEDFHRAGHCEDLKSSDDEHYIPHSKEGSQKSNKCHKTPWAKMKDIIQTRNSFKKKHRLSAQSDDIQIDVELCTDNEDVFDDEKPSNDVPPEIIARYQKAITEDGEDSKKVSKWTRVKKAFLTQPEEERIEDEIQRNYRQLQKKLSLEFQEKMTEWERNKQNSPGLPTTSSSAGGIDEPKDLVFLKKMEEWQKIKSQPSVRKPNIQMTSEENLPPEFRKKLQEWEKIRKGSGKEKKKLAEVPRWKSLKSESPPNLSEDFRKKLEEWKQIKKQATKKQNEKELQWLEKELNKIEKERQRLEGERQRFIEREEALSKLRNSVVGGLKKEVLIHTPSGFYRFEGISRKFTQKLYEWEKAQGIGPESSTFALLDSSLKQDTQNKNASTPSLVRSKSADSIAILPSDFGCQMMSPQPSSLSLNDVEELEKKCLEESRSSSEKFLDEPEALIVEVEDIIEETAAPLEAYAEETQQPFYQRQEIKLHEGETCIAPRIRRSESTRAQNNYNLIEEIFGILSNLQDNEEEIQKIQELEDGNDNDLIRLKMFEESQKAMMGRLIEKVVKLQEANGEVFASLAKEEDFEGRQAMEALEVVQDLSSEIFQLTEKLDSEISNRNVYEKIPESGACSLNPVIELAKDMRKKMLELRRRLSYLCAASDLTAPRRRHSSPKKKTKKTEDGRLYIKAETSNMQSQGAIKKRIRYRQKSQQNRSLADTDEEEEEIKKNEKKKLGRTRSVSESSTKNEKVEVDENLLQKVVVPTQSNILNVCENEEPTALDSPVTVFVKTTRKLFTPLVESGLKTEEETISKEEKFEDNSSESSSVVTPQNSVRSLPPLPSPVLQPKKTKEISPSIRIMMAKYNQQNSRSSKSGHSSEPPSPVSWRSPSFERRVKAQTERYQEELKKSSPLTPRKEIQKSASTAFLPKTTPEEEKKTEEKRLSSELRLQKIQKAKEEFMAAPLSAPVELTEEPIKFPARNRLSQISFNSESSYESACGTLIKSASAGMINIDEDTYRQFDPEVRGYVSLPRNTKKQKEGFLSGKFSNIASKFRKVKMRKGKEKEGKMGVVSALCRQSLVVDIQGLLGEGKREERKEEKDEEKDEEIKSWKKKLFKK